MSLTLRTAHTLLASHPDFPWLDRNLYPFATKSFESEGGTMSYVDEGSGPPILFVHGTPSWSFEWRAVIDALRATHRCIAPDHLGFGLSEKPSDARLTPRDHAERLRAFVEALDLRDVTLVVHDFGGPIGIPIALDLPERISRIVVANSFMWPNGDDYAARRLDRVIRSPLGRFLYLWLSFGPRFLLPSCFGDRSKLTKPIHRHYIEPFARRRDRTATYAMACALLGADEFYDSLWRRRAELSRVPMTIVWGEKDPAFTERHLARWESAFPHAQVVRLPDTGHFVAEESPEA